MHSPQSDLSSSGPPAPSPEEAGISRAYRRVLVVWVVVLAALWWLQHAFI